MCYTSLEKFSVTSLERFLYVRVASLERCRSEYYLSREILCCLSRKGFVCVCNLSGEVFVCVCHFCREVLCYLSREVVKCVYVTSLERC